MGRCAIIVSWVLAIFTFQALIPFENARAGEADTESLRIEIRAMKQAYESRISELEAEVKDLRGGAPSAQAQSTNKAIDETLSKKSPADKALEPVIADNPPQFGGSNVRTPSHVVIGGYTEFSYTDRTSRVPQFSQDKTVLEVSASLSDRIKLYIEFEQETGATLEAGNINGGEWEVEQGYLDFAITKALNFRAGTMLVPLGRFNLYHEGFLNNFVNRPLVDRFVIPTTFWEEGVALHGEPLDTKALGISYELGVYNPAVASAANPDTGFRGISNEGASPAFNGKSTAMRVVFEPARSAPWFADNLEIGISGYLSNYHSHAFTDIAGASHPIAKGALDITAFDLTYEKKNFGFRAEFSDAHVSAGANDARRPEAARGFYAEAFYSWKPCFFNCGPIAKSFKDPRLIFATRFDYVELNPGQTDGVDLKRVTMGVSFRPLHKTVIKLDYQMDFSNSGLLPTQLIDSGVGHRASAILFGVATGF